MTKRKTKPKAKPKRSLKEAAIESGKIAAAATAVFGVVWSAGLFLQDWVLRPVRAEAQEMRQEARRADMADSLRYIGVVQGMGMTNETLGELVVLMAASDPSVRAKMLRRLQAKYEIGVIR